MNAYDEQCLNDLAGRIEGVGRVLLHLVAQLEDSGTIDGHALTDGLRQSIALTSRSDALMQSAKRTVNKAADALDEARHWRCFRRQVGGMGRTSRRRRTA